MSRVHGTGQRDGLAGRLRLSGLLIVSGLGVELASFFWNHPISFALFLSLGAGLTGAGMFLYLWSIVTLTE